MSKILINKTDFFYNFRNTFCHILFSWQSQIISRSQIQNEFNLERQLMLSRCTAVASFSMFYKPLYAKREKLVSLILIILL
jgi:hypothetical protein